MSIFARLLGVGIPVALLLVTRRPRGTDGRDAVRAGGGVRRTPGRARPAAALAFGVCLAAAACLPRERANAGCRWTGDAAALAPAGDPVRRAHLVEDVRVAEDLGVRYADATAGRVPSDAWHRALDQCTAASLAEVVRRHAGDGVTRADVDALRGARDPWVDALAVLLPVALLYVAASRALVRRLVAGYAPGERAGAAAVLAGWAPCAAALGLGVAHLWGGLVEMTRLGNEHISYRGYGALTGRHPWLVWGVALGLFAVAAIGGLGHAPAPAITSRRRIPR